MKKLSLLAGFVLLTLGLSAQKQRTDITYDFSCLSSSNDGGSNDMITLFGDITREIQGGYLSNIEVTVKEEMEYGDQALEDMKEEYKVINFGDEHSKLKKILSFHNCFTISCQYFHNTSTQNTLKHPPDHL